MIPARYSGKCAGCGEAIAEGELIGRVDGDWVCETCVDDAAARTSGLRAGAMTTDVLHPRCTACQFVGNRAFCYDAHSSLRNVVTGELFDDLPGCSQCGSTSLTPTADSPTRMAS
jgi:hypothetical protein